MKNHILLTILAAGCFVFSSQSVLAETKISLNGDIGFIKPEASPYLGTQIGAGPNVFNFVEAGGDLTLRSKGISFQTSSYYGFDVYGSVQNGSANDNQSFSLLDPQGDNLLIPGVGVGPLGEGFRLIGPNNQVSNAYYNTTIDFYKFNLGLKKNYQTSISNLQFTPSFGVGYGQSITENNFGGGIPFFGRSFDYATKTKLKTISPTLGLEASYALNPLFTMFSGVEYAYDINKGRGRDTLNFTGFNAQTATIKNNENTHSYGVKAGINIKIKNLPVITFQGNYKRIGNLPVIQNRDGVQISRFSYEDADVLSATARLTLKF